ncbi:GIY-YIG nuclease family protein [Prochlorococcus marinus]|uniref:GIY-YIG nuclease family protein n=1 Tax=Prochlorococcus marinus TaxID=1219 RepID=UPI0022B36911|nr:GIY-YIG nuclease family protein [Prochlorococcus marinus]
MSEGIVYVLTNPAMPRMVKIGRTGREIGARLSDLYTTGVPLPFECEYAARVKDQNEVESAFHLAFGPYRVNPRREFFNIEPEQAITLLKLMALEDVTPVVQEEAENVDIEAKASTEKFKKARRPNVNLWTMGYMGEQIVFKDGTTKAKVVYDGWIEPEGYKEEDGKVSLTGYTKQLLSLPSDARPNIKPFWTYKGQTLSELYDEWEDAGFPDRSEKKNHTLTETKN